MRLKKDLEAEMAKLEFVCDIQASILNTLVRDRESVVWVSIGNGKTRVDWGLVKLVSMAGGYVIRRHAQTAIYTDLLDNAMRFARERAMHASDYSEETQEVIANEAECARRANSLRERALARKREEEEITL